MPFLGHRATGPSRRRGRETESTASATLRRVFLTFVLGVSGAVLASVALASLADAAPLAKPCYAQGRYVHCASASVLPRLRHPYSRQLRGLFAHAHFAGIRD